MEIKDLILADYAEVDERGKFTIVGGGFSAIGARKLPYVHPLLFVLLRLEATAGDFGKNRFNVQVVGNTGVIFKMDFNIDVGQHPEKKVYRSLPLRIGNLKMEYEGEYHIEIRINGIVKRVCPLMLKIVSNPKSE